MGQWTIVIHGTGCHHNFQKADGKVVPDGEKAIMNAHALTPIMLPQSLFVS
jgi:hypothetical protein